MRSISGIVSIVGILLVASSSAFSVSDVKTVCGGKNIFNYRGYIMLVTVGRFLLKSRVCALTAIASVIRGV